MNRLPTVFAVALLAVASAAMSVNAAPGNGVGQIAYLKCSFYAGSSRIIEDGKCKVWKDGRGHLNIVENKKIAYRFRLEPTADSKLEAVFWNGERSMNNQASAALGKAGILEDKVGKATCWQSTPHSEVPFTLCIE